jgi:anti-sigma B factor antagonist
MTDAPLLIHRRPEVPAHATVLDLEGPLVISHLFHFQTALRAETAKLIVLDLSRVPYMDSSGLGAILNGYVSAEKNGRKLVLSGVSDRVHALLSLTKVDSILMLYPDADAAIAASK